MFTRSDQITGYQGSPLFQPPDVNDPDRFHYLGTKFDVWSSGVTLFNMISGKFLYEADGLIEYVDKLLTQNIVYPEEILNDCPLHALMQGKVNYLLIEFEFY